MPDKPLNLRTGIHPAGGGGFDLRRPEQKPATSADHPMAHQSPAKAKYSPKAQKKVGTVMREFAKGELKSSSGQKVTNPKQAKAIALSEARAAGLKVPKRKKKG